MKVTTQFVVALVVLVVLHHTALAADESKDLIVGKWRLRKAGPDLNIGLGFPHETGDEFLEFQNDGTGQILKVTPKENVAAPISWKITKSFGNACTVFIEYVRPKGKEDKPLPKEARPFNWLIAFDGNDTIVFQLRQNEIFLMERQTPATQQQALEK